MYLLPFLHILLNVYSVPLPIFNLLIYFLVIELFEFIIYFGYQLLIRCMTSKYFLPIHGSSAHSIDFFNSVFSSFYCLCYVEVFSLVHPICLLLLWWLHFRPMSYTYSTLLFTSSGFTLLLESLMHLEMIFVCVMK
jgi:hypothetical protein